MKSSNSTTNVDIFPSFPITLKDSVITDPSHTESCASEHTSYDPKAPCLNVLFDRTRLSANQVRFKAVCNQPEQEPRTHLDIAILSRRGADWRTTLHTSDNQAASAEQRFRAAFERLKLGVPTVMHKGTGSEIDLKRMSRSFLRRGAHVAPIRHCLLDG